MGSQPRRALCIFLTLLTLFLVGTVIVLSTVVVYFGVDSRDVITEAEMRVFERLADAAASAPIEGGKQHVVAPVPVEDPIAAPVVDNDDVWAGAVDMLGDFEKRSGDLGRRAVLPLNLTNPGMSGDGTRQPRIPKIIHQTWKTDTVPERWEKVVQNCKEVHHDYEYMLWSDAASREFIATNYPWFLQAFDGYPYPIQRADAIRYFVLHHYGGVYIDLDVGCRRKMDPLLYFDVILPATIPVGISNDIMFAAKGHPFMDLVIHNLVTFNHQYGTNYPTVMFSTGPMFLSAQYGLWPKDDAAVSSERQVRVLPRRWYGKNAPATEMGDSFFTHFYGSSWHADDAWIITFLGKFGMVLMYSGVFVVVLGALRLAWSKRSVLKKPSPRSVGPIALPFHVADEFSRPGTPGGSRPSSPFAGRSPTPTRGHRRDDSNGSNAPAAAGRGVLYYLPVWFPQPTSATQGGWGSFLPGFEEAGEHPYEPIPNFSRPPSPSNNSILHAPGAHHDGAFDGVPLHSIQTSASTSTRSPTSPTSLSPPAYSTLKNWGTGLFRSSPFSTQSPEILPRHVTESSSSTPAASHPTPAPDHQQPSQHRRTASRNGHARSSSRTESPARAHHVPRARSPLPPNYTPNSATPAHHVGSGEDLEGRGQEVDRLLSEMTPNVKKAD